MTALQAAVERVVSAFSAVLHESQDGLPDFDAFQRLLRDPALGLSEGDLSTIQSATLSVLSTQIEAEILKRRVEGCWPHDLVRRFN